MWAQRPYPLQPNPFDPTLEVTYAFCPKKIWLFVCNCRALKAGTSNLGCARGPNRLMWLLKQDGSDRLTGQDPAAHILVLFLQSPETNSLL